MGGFSSCLVHEAVTTGTACSCMRRMEACCLDMGMSVGGATPSKGDACTRMQEPILAVRERGASLPAQHIWMVDSKGLITRKRKDGDHLPKHKQQMARVDDPPLQSVTEVIAHAKPHALIGLSGAGPSWDQARGAPCGALVACKAVQGMKRCTEGCLKSYTVSCNEQDALCMGECLLVV